MNFTQAIRTVFRENYANFSGRASRAQFWWWALFLILIYMIFSGLFIVFGGANWLNEIWNATASGAVSIPPAPGMVKFLGFAYLIFVLAVILPNLAVTTRRFHDRGLSGWIFLALLIGTIIPYLGLISAIAIIVICILPGNPGDNKYGAQPAG